MGTRFFGISSNKTLTEEERRFAKMDHPYVGDPIYVCGHRICICKGLKNSGKINTSILEEALHKIHNNNPLHLIVDRLQITVDFQRELGLLRCIQTYYTDLVDIFFAPYRDSDDVLVRNRQGEKIYRRYIRNRRPEKTSLLSVIIEADPTRVITAHIGPQSRLMPGIGDALFQIANGGIIALIRWVMLLSNLMKKEFAMTIFGAIETFLGHIQNTNS